MATTTTSNFLSLNLKDGLKGALLAAITAILAAVGQSIEAGALPTLAQFKIAGLAGLTAGIAYLLKNLFSAPTITITNPPAATIDAVKTGEAKVTITPTNS